MNSRSFFRLAAALAFAVLAGCAAVVNKASQKLSDDLTAGILNQDDIELAKTGIPSWLLLVDGLVDGDPNNSGLLLADARLYGAYAGGFVDDAEQDAWTAAGN